MHVLPECDVDPVERPNLNRSTNRDGYTFVGGIERGMIFWGEVPSSEHRHAEHFHEQPRPCPWLVLSPKTLNRKLPLVIVAPLTSKLEKEQLFRGPRIRLIESHISHYGGVSDQERLKGDSLVLTEQIRVFAHDRLLGNPIAKVSIHALATIEAGIKFVLDIQ